jgi:hypothetical protein
MYRVKAVMSVPRLRERQFQSYLSQFRLKGYAVYAKCVYKGWWVRDYEIFFEGEQRRALVVSEMLDWIAAEG